MPAGATTTVQVRDYLCPTTNGANIIVNHKLTGAGTINLVGIDFAAGYNGGGVFQLRNTANDFSGIINVGTNAVLENNSNDAGKTGSTLGTATINLNGGVLRVRNERRADAYRQQRQPERRLDDRRRRAGTAATDQTFTFGTLTVAAGTKSSTRRMAAAPRSGQRLPRRLHRGGRPRHARLWRHPLRRSQRLRAPASPATSRSPGRRA